MHPRLSPLVASLVVLAALAGCVKDDATPPADGGTTPVTSTPTPTTPGTGGGGGSGGNVQNPPPVTDKGSIQGPFDKSWTVPVPAVSPKAVTVVFNLTGVQAGAPPTASVFLAFKDPDGKTIKSAALGVGGSGNSVNWGFTAADILLTGDYKLVASANPTPGGAPAPTPLPSGGLANYDMSATVEY